MEVIIADGQELTALGLTQLARHGADCDSLGAAVDFRHLAVLLTESPSALIIIDPDTFDITSPDRLLLLVERFPESLWLIVSTHPGRELLRRFSGHPRTARALKTDSLDELTEVIRAISNGQPVDSRGLLDVAAGFEDTAHSLSSLTPVETEILRLIALGKSVKEIAALRSSSAHTITTHKKNLFRKLGVNTVYEATCRAMRAGLVEQAEYYI